MSREGRLFGNWILLDERVLANGADISFIVSAQYQMISSKAKLSPLVGEGIL